MTGQLVPNPDPRIAFPVPDGDVGQYFPLVTSSPMPDTFEIGLVLGGTVSAAAYTAGVIDFLIEALDAWTVAKTRGDAAAPLHKTIIRILSGTSGGGISCVLLARTIGSAFPPCTEMTTPEERALNPFYNVWVNQIDMTDLLQTDDLDGSGPLTSLLCPQKLDVVSDQMARYRGPPLGLNGTPHKRDYIEPLLPVVLTLTNLRGIPYSAYFRGPSKRPEFYVDNADHFRFRVDVTGTNPPAPETLKPYEVGISETAANGVQPWITIIHVARGTSAFPVGLPPQTIARDPQHYRYRYAVIGPDAEWLRPAWPYMLPVGSEPDSPYQFLCVDGGCFDNEPIEFARQWLAGVLGQNEQRGDRAHRAVVLVDPLVGAPGVGLIMDAGILSTGGATLSSFIAGSRFETADLDLFTAEDVFSRFLVNPVRTEENGMTLSGGAALATACLGAFGGFLSSAFRAHDFFLGRRNCQQFLRNNFTLPPNNALFARWTEAQREKYRDSDGFLPVVPLMDSVAGEIRQPSWPRGAFTPESIKDLIEKRLARFAEVGAAGVTGPPKAPMSWLLDWAASGLASAGAGKVIEIVTKGLQTANLL